MIMGERRDVARLWLVDCFRQGVCGCVVERRESPMWKGVAAAACLVVAERFASSCVSARGRGERARGKRGCVRCLSSSYVLWLGAA